jgi:hypothetical protein
MFMASKMRELFEKHDEEYRLFEEVKILEAKLKAQPACNKPGRCWREYVNDSSPEVAPQIEACEETK